MNITDCTCYMSTLELRGVVCWRKRLKFEYLYCNSLSRIVPFLQI